METMMMMVEILFFFPTSAKSDRFFEPECKKTIADNVAIFCLRVFFAGCFKRDLVISV